MPQGVLTLSLMVRIFLYEYEYVNAALAITSI